MGNKPILARVVLLCLVFSGLLFFVAGAVSAQTQAPVSAGRVRSVVSPSPSISPSSTLGPTTAPKVDITQKTEEAVGPLEKILNEQVLGPVWPKNPLKYAIRAAVDAGVPANTIVLLLLLPFVAAVIAATRQLIGIRGFGIFMPASLSVVFVATGPVLGISLFLLIVAVSTAVRIFMRKTKIKLQYLPRMSLILWFVAVSVLGVLFLAPVMRWSQLSNVSIFAILILALLVEDFIKVQLGKSVKVAFSLTAETLLLAVVSYFFLTNSSLHEFVLVNPEVFLLGVLTADVLLGKYSGLRFREILRFKKLLSS